MLKEYKEFLFRGNLLDLAVAFILGSAFAAVIQAFANDVIVGTIANTVGLPDVSDLALGPVLIGTFLGAVIFFVIVATVLFAIIKAAARFQQQDEASPVPADDVVLLQEIRDLLRAQQTGAAPDSTQRPDA